MKNKIILVLLFLCFVIQIFILIKPNETTKKSNDLFDYQSLTNIVETLVNSRISSQVVGDAEKRASTTSEVYANSYTCNYSCSFVGGRPALQFFGSSAIYFLGEFCPYGKLLTITPYRCLIRQGSSFAVLYNSHDNINVNLVDKDESEDTDKTENTFPKSINFFGGK